MTDEDSIGQDTPGMDIEETGSRPITVREAFDAAQFCEFLIRGSMHEYPVYDHEGERYILSALEDLSNLLEETDLDIGINSQISKLRNEIKESHDSFEKLDSEDSDVGELDFTIKEPYSTRLQERAEVWLELIREKLDDEERVSIKTDGIVEIQKAIKSPEELFFDEQIWESLPVQTQNDIQEAVRNLAFDCPTSSVFMSLRAVEERLQAWYVAETEREIDDRTFGQVLSELDDTYDGEDRPPILSHLDYLKARRNQVAHPERSPDLQEAESTIVMVRETLTNIQSQLGES